MKIFDIALKDLKHIFQSVFSLVMMFGAPLMITGLLYFAFGGLSSGKGGFSLPVTSVQVVNLDQPDMQKTSFAAGQMLTDFLQDKSLSDILEVSLAQDETSARLAVDEQQAGVAIIIPNDFTSAVTSPDQTASVIIYQDPTLTIGPSIVKDLVNHFMDGFSGSKIASQVTMEMWKASNAQVDPSLQYNVAQQYTTWLQSNGHGKGESVPALSIVPPVGKAQSSNQGAALIGPIMAGMLVMFVFFMGANGAESIILEDEQGTLDRIFSTPTSLWSILGGKFLGVFVTLCIQTAILLLASTFLFGIQWGRPETVILVSFGFIVASAGFGVLLMSFVKNSRQTGPVLGGFMTLTGMLGGLFTTGIPTIPAGFTKVTLVTPQGWALQAWLKSLSGAGAEQILIPVMVMVLMGFAFLGIGMVLFRKRFA